VIQYCKKIYNLGYISFSRIS